ncbi:hypothetical protein ACF0H5_000310 [Mactra antiquata]
MYVTGMTSAMSMASRGWSGYVDSLSGHAIKNYTVTHIANWTSHGSPFPEYPDMAAIFIVLVVMVIGSVGVNCSSIINSVLTAVAASLLIFITIVGFCYSNIENWTKVPGGFFPNGLKGLLKASSSCFYAFQGYEILGLSAEETVNPKRDIPRALISVLVIVLTLYLSVAVSFTLMVPYTNVNPSAPFPGAFEANGVTWAKYIVEIGPVLALTNLVILELFTIQRMVFSMSEDGLLFSYLSKVNSYTKVPIGPVVTFCPIVILLLLCIDLSNLIGFMVFYIFVQYSTLASYLIILRYEPQISISSSPVQNDTKFTRTRSSNILEKISQFVSVTKLVVCIYCLLFILSLLIVLKGDEIFNGNVTVIVFVVILSILVAIATFVIACREQTGNIKGFLVPFMPVVPVLTMFSNILMLVSAAHTGTVVASITLALIGKVVICGFFSQLSEVWIITW